MGGVGVLKGLQSDSATAMPDCRVWESAVAEGMRREEEEGSR